MPKVSVIIPNYNHSKFLPQRIESVLNQTYQDFELILLDDCSSDNSREILEQYRNHHKVSQIVYNINNSGSTFKQWEKGIGLTTGEYIWLAESDDYCEPNFLSELVSLLDKYPNAGIAYCQSRSVDQNNVPLNSWIKQTDIFSPNIWNNSFIADGNIAIANFLIHQNVIPNASAVVYRKSVYYLTTGINTLMALNGDWLLWIKMLEISDLAFLQKELNYFRQHTNKATGFNTKNYNGLKELFELYFYIQEKFGITSKQKREMTNVVLRIWLYQMVTENLILGIRNIPKVVKAAYSFNKFFFFNVIFVAISFILRKILFIKFKPKINISKVAINQLQ